ISCGDPEPPSAEGLAAFAGAREFTRRLLTETEARTRLALASSKEKTPVPIMVPGTTRREFFGKTLAAAAAAALTPTLAMSQATHGAAPAASPVALELARFLSATRYEALPRIAVEHAKIVVASTLASAAPGSRIDSARTGRTPAQEGSGRGGATLRGDGARRPAAQAARVSST